MSFITPPATFINDVRSSGAVTGASYPCYATNGSVGIFPLSATNDGYLTRATQTVPGIKMFPDGLTIGTTTLIEEVDTDITLAANSDNRLVTQKALKTYIDTQAPLSGLTFSAPLARLIDNVSLLNDGGATVTSVSTDGTLAGNSDVDVPTEKAVKTYVDPAVALTTGVDYIGKDGVGHSLTCYTSSVPRWIADASGLRVPGDLLLYDGASTYRYKWYNDANRLYLAEYDGSTNTVKASFNHGIGMILMEKLRLANLAFPTVSYELYDAGASTVLQEAVTNVKMMEWSTSMNTSYSPIRLASSPESFEWGSDGSVAYLLRTTTSDQLVTIGDSGSYFYRPLLIASALPNQFIISRSLGVDGRLSVDSSGYLNLSASGAEVRTGDKIVSSNDTEGDGVTGAIVTAGGITAAKNIVTAATVKAAKAEILSTSPNQLSVFYSTLVRSNFTTDVDGYLTINTSGNRVYFHQTDIVTINSTTDSTSTTTGALVTTGGVGIGLGVHIGGLLHVTNTTNVNSGVTTGSIYTAGGIGAANAIACLGDMQGNRLIAAAGRLTLLNGATNSLLQTDTNGYLTINTTGNRVIFDQTDVVYINSVTGSTSPITGSLITGGGIGVTENVRVGGTVSVHNGVASNGISCDANSNLVLTSPRWKDLYSTAMLRGSGGTSAVWEAVDATDMWSWGFQDGADRFLWASVQLPHDMKMGTSIIPHVHFMNDSNATTGNAYWGIAWYKSTTGNKLITTVTTDKVAISANSATNSYVNMFGSLSAIPTLATDGGATIIFKMGRYANDPLDTCTQKLYLLGFDFHYQADKVCGDDGTY